MTETSRRRPATRDRERTRQAVIAAAEQLLRERGTRFSIADVAAAVAISKGGLLHHFPNRDALLVAVVEQAIARFRDEVMRHTDIAENRAGKLLRGYVRALCGGSDEAISTFAPFSHWAGIEDIPEIAELLRADAAWWRTAFGRDGLPDGRAHTVRFAAEGVAAAIATGVSYITKDELIATRTALLDLAEPEPEPGAHP